MPKIATDIPDDLYKEIEEEVRLGIFQDISEAINAAIRKAYAKKSRRYLRWLTKKGRHHRSFYVERAEKYPKMRYRIFLDTNILISGIFFDGAFIQTPVFFESYDFTNMTFRWFFDILSKRIFYDKRYGGDKYAV